MEFSLRPLGFMEFLQNNNHQAVSKMKKKLRKGKNNHQAVNKMKNIFHFFNCLMIVVLLKLHETQGSQSNFHNIEYIYIY